jgi:hypothetical protein
MSDMIERVANAIAAKYAPAVDQRAPYAKIMMLEAAKAAIEALREPTEAMYLARPVGIPERADWNRIWGWQIEAMLEGASQTPGSVHKSADDMT